MKKDQCSLQHQPLLSLDTALAQILDAIEPVSSVCYMPLYDALGRVLADDIIAPINLPFDQNSAMDGYALNGGDIQPKQAFALTLVGASWAGKPYESVLQRGQCVRIFTGAVVPDGADTVVMQEAVSLQDDKVCFPADVQAQQNIRYAGEDIKAGSLLLARGKQLTPADIGLLAATGISEVRIFAEPNLAFFATGDELISFGQALTTGKIYDSNRYALDALLAGFPIDSVDMGIIADDKRKLKSCIKRMSQTNDVIVSIGGASVGEADYIKQVLAELGEVKVWKIAIKPGKPLIFGKIGACYYFGLPGNPVSMMLTFQQLVAPALKRLVGMQSTKPLRLLARCTDSLKKTPGRQEFQRGIVSQDSNGDFWVASAGKQGSHVLSSLSRSNCYIILPADCQGVQAGEKVWIQPLSLFW